MPSGTAEETSDAQFLRCGYWLAASPDASAVDKMIGRRPLPKGFGWIHVIVTVADKDCRNESESIP